MNLIQHYRGYFSEAYSELKKTITRTIEDITVRYGEGVRVNFEQRLRIVGERRQFWSQFCEIEEFSLDADAIFKSLNLAREAVLDLLSAKSSAPLDTVVIASEARSFLSGYEKHRMGVVEVNILLKQVNQRIDDIRENVNTADAHELSKTLAHLKTIKSRYRPEINQLCRAYLDEVQAKAKTEGDRDAVRDQLEFYRTHVFPAYQSEVNLYLEKFGVGFRLSNMNPHFPYQPCRACRNQQRNYPM